VLFVLSGLDSGGKCPGVDQRERRVRFCGAIQTFVVFMNAPLQIVSQADVDIITCQAAKRINVIHVPKEGLEPSCLATHAPETCVSTNSTTSVK
jgi:hypothetical protein